MIFRRLIVCFTIIASFSFSVCFSATHETSNVSDQVAKILASNLNIEVTRKDGVKFVVYFFAPNEVQGLTEGYPCDTSEYPEPVKFYAGRYDIYLYEPIKKRLVKQNIQLFADFKDLRFYQGASDLWHLSGKSSQQSDVILVGQFGSCNGDFFEAVGFTASGDELTSYAFSEGPGKGNKKRRIFGRIDQVVGDRLITNAYYNAGPIQAESITWQIDSQHEMLRALNIQRDKAK